MTYWRSSCLCFLNLVKGKDAEMVKKGVKSPAPVASKKPAGKQQQPQQSHQKKKKKDAKDGTEDYLHDLDKCKNPLADCKLFVGFLTQPLVILLLLLLLRRPCHGLVWGFILFAVNS